MKNLLATGFILIETKSFFFFIAAGSYILVIPLVNVSVFNCSNPTYVLN